MLSSHVDFFNLFGLKVEQLGSVCIHPQDVSLVPKKNYLGTDTASSSSPFLAASCNLPAVVEALVLYCFSQNAAIVP